MEITTTCTVSEDDFLEAVMNLPSEDIREFLCRVDLAIADVAFTKKLVRRICGSLRQDLTEKEWASFCKGIRGLKP